METVPCVFGGKAVEVLANSHRATWRRYCTILVGQLFLTPKPLGKKISIDEHFFLFGRNWVRKKVHHLGAPCKECLLTFALKFMVNACNYSIHGGRIWVTG